MDIDRPKRDFNKSPEDLYDNKYVDSLAAEVNNIVILSESPSQDCIAEVKEMRVDAGIDNRVESSVMFLHKTSTEEDIKGPFSADLNLSLNEQHSAVQECIGETDATNVKDICIDEGLPVKEKIHSEDVFEAQKNTVDDIHPVKDEEFGSKNVKLDAECLIPMSLKSSTDLVCEKDFTSRESKVIVNSHESKNEAKKLVLRDFLKEKVFETLSIRDTAADDSQLKTSARDIFINEQDIAPKDTLTETEEGNCKSRSSTSEETADPGKMETSVVKTKNSDLLKLPDTSQMPRRLDTFLKATDHLTASAPLQQDQFESSFASVGHYASSITYSGPIAYSGSLSHRSDASTASTRSFAFPVLKNEWNFSPVRMQKAKRRQLRKRKLMHCLFCCKF